MPGNADGIVIRRNLRYTSFRQLLGAIRAPDAVLVLYLYNFLDREVRLTATTGPRTETNVGDFSDEVDNSKSLVVPSSSINSAADVAGFGLVYRGGARA